MPNGPQNPSAGPLAVSAAAAAVGGAETVAVPAVVFVGLALPAACVPSVVLSLCGAAVSVAAATSAAAG